MTRVALYARYSDDMQSPASIEDQFRTCRERAQREGWTVVEEYADRAITGSVMARVGLQRLLSDARLGKFDVVLAEALDRLSRDLEGTAHIFKRLKFAKVRLVTLSENEVDVLHVGLKGTMNQSFLTELRRKTHRGLEGRVLAGKSAGGLAYGYAMVRNFDANGELIRGERMIKEEEAEIVRRIFREYCAGKSPRKIALELNAERIPGPRGNAWSASTIYGNRKRGIGIINNELYSGMLVWDRQGFDRDPDTGKRVARPNDEGQLKRVEVPHLRIVDQELWDEARRYQATLDRKSTVGEMRRPPRLFSHLLKCGCCGGGMSIVAQGRYGCSTARNKGICDNRITIMEKEIEHRVLGALRHRLMDPKLCQVFCDEYTKHLNATRMAHNAARAQHERELERVERGIKKLIQSIKDGVPGVLLKDEAIELDRRKTELLHLLASKEEAPVLVHPRMGERYREQIGNLISSLRDPQHHDRSALILRKLIEKIVLKPNEDKSALTLDLIGDLAGILLMSTKQAPEKLFKPNGELDPAQLVEIEQAKDVSGHPVDYGKVSVVAGAGFEPATFRL